MVGQAFGMVVQHLQHAAICRSAAGAVMHHAFQFGTQCFQSGKPLLDLPQLPPGDGVSLMAWPIRMV